MTPPRVPPYLGRILGPDGQALGTCFQLTGGILVTAAHVLDDVAGVGESVTVDPLGGGETREASVVAIDEVADLAALRATVPLQAAASRILPSDPIGVGTEITISGVSHLDDAEHEYRFLEAGGTWQGAAERSGVPLARLEAKALVPGLSGAPVRRKSDDAVVGVVSGRYNSVDGWVEHTGWVARTEHLDALLAGIAPDPVERAAPAGRRDLVLSVSDTEVRLVGTGPDVVARHRGVSSGLAGAVDDVRRARARAGAQRQLSPDAPGAGTLAVGLAGQLLGASFLPVAVARALGATLAQAVAANQGLRLGRR